jgi:cell division protein FtsI/penicillin-binding protein 2
VSAVVALLLTVAACTSGTPKKDDGANRAAAALAEGLGKGTLSVAVQGQSAAVVQRALSVVTAGMASATASVKVDGVAVDGDQAAVRLRWTWDLPGTDTPWSYDAPAVLVERAGTWRLRWAPTVVEPTLKTAESMEAKTLLPQRADILGAHGSRLVKDRPVRRFGIDKTKVSAAKAAKSARQLAVLLGLDAGAYQKRVVAAGKKAFVEAVVLREGGISQRVNTRYPYIRGATAIPDVTPLAPTQEFARAILGSVGPVTAEMLKAKHSPYAPGDEAGLSGLEQRYDGELRGSPGVQVTAVTADGADRTLFSLKPRNGSALRTTLDPRLQRSAESALASTGPASALVAVRPSDGAILAAASGPGSKGYNTATFGQYAPGSTFKVVTALGLLRSGLSTTSRVPCTPTISVDGKSFKNYDDYPPGGLGHIALRTAFANSCNTAFISQRNKLTDANQEAAAAALGFGVDHDLGFPAYFGSVPSADTETEHAASMIGQGRVLASPMAMAAVVASVVRGAAVVPRLLVGHDPGAQSPAKPLTAREAEQLRSMMRSTVTEGSASLLAGLPGPPVIAKTGTAEFGTGNPPSTHAWMIAAQGDLAVAVFVDRGNSGSGTAGPILEAFLRAARS